MQTKTGWYHVRTIDLKKLGREYVRCGRESCNRLLRFVHFIKHPDKGTLAVGRCCASRICYGYDPEREERKLKNLYYRRSRWLLRNWGTTGQGNDTLTLTHDKLKVRVVVFPKRDSWKYALYFADDSFFSPERYDSSDDAKFAAFDDLAERLGW